MNAIVKSKGIITEEGGILSHASVISRELKKTRIIAFKGITKLTDDMIYEIMGKQVMLDSDIAKLYQVETKRVNEPVKNNLEKFPERFYLNEILKILDL